MILYPQAKINIGLRILRKRPDGYHDLESLFYPLPLYDILEIIDSGAGEDEFHQSGIKLDSDGSDNLVMKAVRLIREYYKIPHFRIHLHKIIPAGAGLGGGSGDAAYCIRAINSLCSLDLSFEKMKEYAAFLGSDCPFFIDPRPSIAGGRGEILEEFQIDIKDYTLILIVPGVHVSTAEAYRGIVPAIPGTDFKELLKHGPGKWKGILLNDFESTVFAKYPILGEVKDYLYSKGAVYASMSGSGSSLYGIFRDDIPVDGFKKFGQTWKFLL